MHRPTDRLRLYAGPLRRIVPCLVIAFAAVSCLLPAAVNDNTEGNRGIPTTTWPAGTLLAKMDRGGRQATFHRGWLYVLCTGVDGDGPNQVWNIADPTNPALVDLRPVGGNGHRFFHIGDLFSRAYSVPEIAILPDEDKLLPDGSRTRFLDLSDVPNRIGFLDQSAVPFPLDRNTGGTMNWPYRFRNDGILDYNSQDRLCTIDWAAEAGIPEKGQSVLIGNLYIVSGAQKGGGPVAAYDVSDPTRPQLLDVLPIHANGYVGGNVQVYGHYFVTMGAASIIDGRTYNCIGVDFSDPTDLKLAWAYESSQVPGRYMEHQDHWGFTAGRKIDMRKVIANEAEVNELRFTEGSTDFVSMPVGHLLVASGSNTNPGVTYLYSHQDTVDTTPPTLAYHLPRDGETNLPVTSNIGLLIHETLDATTVVPENIQLRPVGGDPIDTLVVMYDYDVIHIAPIGDLAPDTTYELAIIDGTVMDVAGNAMAGTSFTFSTGDADNEAPVVGEVVLDPVGPVEAGTTVACSISASDPEGGSLQYRWDFGDAVGVERSRTDWSNDPSASHPFDRAGNYTVVVQVRDDHDRITAATTHLVVTDPVPAEQPTRSGTLAIDDQRRVVWVADPDNDRVTRIDADSRTTIGSPTTVDDHPAAIMVDDDGHAWVANRDADSLQRIAPDGQIVDRIALPHGARPVALVRDPTRADTAYLAEAGRARVIRLDTASGELGAYWDLDADAGTGLVALHYDDQDLSDAFHKEVIGQIDNDWGDGAPVTGMANVDAFSIRYLGRITPAFSEEYTFTTLTSGDASRLWIGGQEVIDDWNPWGNSASGTIVLEAGKSYDFMLEYKDNGGTAKLTLEWSSASQTAETVPASALRQPRVIDRRPRAMAVSGDGRSLLVTQFLSPDLAGLVWRIDLDSDTIADRILLPLDATTQDGTANGRGVPNLLTGIAIAPQNDRAWLPAVKANIRRGTFRDGDNLDFETTLRALVTPLDLTTNMERAAARLDIDNHGHPYAVAYSPAGNHVFVSLQDNQRVIAIDAHTGGEVARSDVGIAPQSLVIDPVTGHLWVHDFLSRQVSVLDASGVLNNHSGPIPLLGQTALGATEALTAEVLRGKQLFYSARDPDDPEANPSRMTLDAYISCAACHLDGGHDGRTWDFTDRGEGLRNTISLRGRRGTGHGPVHWTANFDEIHDFEHDIRGPFGGTGFMADADFDTGTRNTPLGDTKAGVSADLDALAAYVSSLTSYPRSPHRRPDGALTAQAVHGKVLFQRLECTACHSGPDFTDSASLTRHDIGTLTTASGQRLGATLDGIDTPTLKGLWATAPYLHDGSAETLADVFHRAGDGTTHAAVNDLAASDREALLAYLGQIDGAELRAPSGNRRISITVSRGGTPDEEIEALLDPDFSTSRSVDTGTTTFDGLPAWHGERIRFDLVQPTEIGELLQQDGRPPALSADRR